MRFLSEGFLGWRCRVQFIYGCRKVSFCRVTGVLSSVSNRSAIRFFAEREGSSIEKVLCSRSAKKMAAEWV